jgi:hypothetical protein
MLLPPAGGKNGRNVTKHRVGVLLGKDKALVLKPALGGPLTTCSRATLCSQSCMLMQAWKGVDPIFQALLSIRVGDLYLPLMFSLQCLRQELESVATEEPPLIVMEESPLVVMEEAPWAPPCSGPPCGTSDVGGG